MLRELIDRILALAEIQQVNQDGQTFVDRKVFPLIPPVPVPIKVSGLRCVVDYINSDIDFARTPEEDGRRTDIAVLVRSHKDVVVLAGLGAYNEREEYLVAEAPARDFPFGVFMDVEQFIIGLQTWFVQDEVTRALLAFVGNLSDGVVRNLNDDGVSQEVQTKVGITKVANVAAPSPVLLSPYRTFREVEQPSSFFILRLKSGAGNALPSVALFEADGGKWKIDAVARVKEFLAKELPVVNVLA